MFQACFTQSPVFARAVLSLLWEKCSLKGKVPDGRDWVCEYQPATPNGGAARPDLCLRSATDSYRKTTNYKPIFIESKVGAQLGEPQLRRYLESGTQVLVAVTKNWPEVSTNRLSELGIKYIRWQDVSRVLSEVRKYTAKDRFLCESFVEYLEYSGMSYREDISISHLEDMRKLFSDVATPTKNGFVPKSTFVYADSCLALLRDVRRIAQEKNASACELQQLGPRLLQLGGR